MKNLKITNMKALVNLLAIITVLLIGCKSDDDVLPVDSNNQQEQILNKLVDATWIIESVTVDNLNQNGLFENFSLLFGDGTFTSENGGEVWAPTGTWVFVDEEAKAIKRDDETVINIVSLTESSLVLSLSWSENTIGPGRINSISGEHVFTFSK